MQWLGFKEGLGHLNTRTDRQVQILGGGWILCVNYLKGRTEDFKSLSIVCFRLKVLIYKWPSRLQFINFLCMIENKSVGCCLGNILRKINF